MAGLAKEYERFRGTRNLTFVGVCASLTATPASMAQQAERFKVKPFATMLDAGGATSAAYDVPRRAYFWLVVVDAEGKIAFNASHAWTWTESSTPGKTVFQDCVEATVKKSPGILGAAEIPRGMEAAAHYFDLQQFGLFEPELQKAESRTDEAAVRFIADARAKVEAGRKTRLDQLKALLESDPYRAYHEAKVFSAAYPQAPEKADVAALLKKLQALPLVKKELAAEEAFQKMIVPPMRTATTYKLFQERVQPAWLAYQKSHGSTRFAAVAEDAVITHKKSVP